MHEIIVQLQSWFISPKGEGMKQSIAIAVIGLLAVFEFFLITACAGAIEALSRKLSSLEERLAKAIEAMCQAVKLQDLAITDINRRIKLIGEIFESQKGDS
jgi:hypothetical protein